MEIKAPSKAASGKILLMLSILILAVLVRLPLLLTALNNFTVNADEGLSFLQAHKIAQGEYFLFFWTQPYQFPFEAYLSSLFVDLLPWNSLGVRAIPLALCLLAVPGFLSLYMFFDVSDSEQSRGVRLKEIWPGVLLILFPSAYWLLRQVALMTPQHAAMVTFAWAMLFCFGVSKRVEKRRYVAVALGGLIAGMAISNHLLSLSLVALVAAGFCVADSFRTAMKSSCAFTLGFLSGSSPYLYSKLFVPGAYERVAERLPLQAAWKQLWNPILTQQVPTVLGVDPWILPDAMDKISTFSVLRVPATWFFIVLLVTLTFIRLRCLFQRLVRTRWPGLELIDIFVGTTWLALLLLSVTKMDLRTRYALHVVWCFPFLFSYAYTISPKYLRVFLGFTAILFVMISVSNTTALERSWREPGFSEGRALMPPLKPLFKYFKRHDITRCYAGWWVAYRINLRSKGKIVCSPPFNDRFASWPQPFYKRIVDESSNVPYVIGPYIHRHLRIENFEKHLIHHYISADKRVMEGFTVYQNFRHTDGTVSSLVSPEDLVASPSHNQGEHHHLVDGDLETVWSSGENQHDKMFIELRLNEERIVHALQLFTRDFDIEKESPRLEITVKTARGEWVTAQKGFTGHPHIMQLDQTRIPESFPHLRLTIGFQPIATREIRIGVDTPKEKRLWELAEIKVFAQAE